MLPLDYVRCAVTMNSFISFLVYFCLPYIIRLQQEIFLTLAVTQRDSHIYNDLLRLLYSIVSHSNLCIFHNKYSGNMIIDSVCKFALKTKLLPYRPISPTSIMIYEIVFFSLQHAEVRSSHSCW